MRWLVPVALVALFELGGIEVGSLAASRKHNEGGGIGTTKTPRTDRKDAKDRCCSSVSFSLRGTWRRMGLGEPFVPFRLCFVSSWF